VWLENWTKESRQGPEDEQMGEVSEERSAFTGAFDTIGAHTPTALQLLTAYKCDHLGRQFETAEGLRSAFKLYWERCVCHTVVSKELQIATLIEIITGFMAFKANTGG
jgi:hypothetical protein